MKRTWIIGVLGLLGGAVFAVRRFMSWERDQTVAAGEARGNYWFRRARAATTSRYMRVHVIFVGMARVQGKANLACGTARSQHILRHAIWPQVLAGRWDPGQGIARSANLNQNGRAVLYPRGPPPASGTLCGRDRQKIGVLASIVCQIEEGISFF